MSSHPSVAKMLIRLTPKLRRRHKNNISFHSAPSSRAHTPEPPECPDSNGAGMPGKCHTLHASMQNVSLPVTLNGGGTGDAPSTPPRVIRPVTLQVPDVDSGGNSANVITDQGDTTTDDDEEVLCEGHEHKNIQCLDEVFSIPIDRMFEILFSDTKLFRAFMEARKTSDLQMTTWTDPDSDGNRTRELKFTLALNYTLGPKCSYSHEKQTCYASSRPGLSYLIDAEFINSGIPYGENFYVINRYCLTRVTSHKCRLRVTSEINFRKKVWALVRSYIDKNGTIGIMQNFEMLAEHLHRESECLSEAVPSSTTCNVGTTQPGRKKVRRKKRPTSTERTTKRLADINVAKHTQVSAPKGGVSPDEWIIKFNMDTLARIFCIVLVCLLIFNAVLFVKLRSLEAMTCMAPFSRDNIFPDARDFPKSQDEWMQLLERQQFLHETEIKRWKDVLSVVIKLMDQMKMTLVELEQSIARASSVDPPEHST
ncbi:Protein Aster-B [Lamellibrachia satsuma]|nr:Protein Aster-B [Lamellibrachia satsuma]